MAGEWAKFVADNKAAEQKDSGVRYIGTRHPDWPVDEKKIFSERQIKNKADQIVDKHYQKNKNKSPFTQAAENAVKELSFTMRDGHIENNAGNHRLTNVKEAIEINDALDKNFRDHKQDDYLKLIESHKLAQKDTPAQTWDRLDANEKKRQRDHVKKLEHFGIENSQTKHAGYPKVSNPPILRNNINHPKRINPTVKKYKDFKENQKKKLEDKKHDEEFKKEYSDKAMEKYVRGKVSKNIRAGKAPYEDLPTAYLVVGEAAKDRAKKQLAEIKMEPVKLQPTYIDYRLAQKDVGPTISLEEHMAKVAPREIDPAGITALDEAKPFKNVVDLTDQKFPKIARGIGPFISGEDDSK